MKSLLLLSFMFLLLPFQFYGQSNTKIERLKSQIFQLDTISWKLIKGKNETVINFSREDFKVDKNQKLTLELKEYVNSSHIFFLNVTTNGQNVFLKKNRRIPIKVKKQNLKRNEIYHSAISAYEKLNWTKLPRFSGVFHFDVKLQMDVIKPVRSDSLDCYIETYFKNVEYNPVVSSIMIDRLGWFKIELLNN